MDLESYKEEIKSWSDEILLDQLDATEEGYEICCFNADDTFGEEQEHYWEMRDEFSEQIDILKEEISNRGLDRSDE